jgi:poly(3-hydroxyalkanoate) synthetase
MQTEVTETAEISAKKRESRSIEERLEALAKKKKELIEEEKRLKAKLSDEERRKRNKRLIEIGATVESVLGDKIEKDDLPKLIAFLTKQEERGKYFSSAMGKNT